MSTRWIIKIYIVLLSISFIIPGIFIFKILTATGPLMSVSFLDVGQGDAIYIELPDRTSILIDGGVDNSVVYELGAVMPWWKHHIDFVIVTHPDLDHYGGLHAVAEKYSIGSLLHNGHASDEPYFQLLLSTVEDRGTAIRAIEQGLTLVGESGVELQVVWPRRSYDAEDKNSLSIATLLSWHDVDFLLTGDLGQAEEHEIVADYPLLSAEVLKLGHHGSKYSSSFAFLTTVSPRYCIVSAGAGNSYGHPHKDVLDRAHDIDCELSDTAHEGTITFHTDGYDIAREVAKPLYMRL